MAAPRDIRRMAFQALYQLDARGEEDVEAVRAALDDFERQGDSPVADADRDRALTLALAAYRDRRAADAAIGELAPTWPAHRQPAVDRAILRLAHYEMTAGRVAPKIAVNEAVELAKRYSTERSPAFINGVLDRILKRLATEAPEIPETSDPTAPPAAPTPAAANDEPTTPCP